MQASDENIRCHVRERALRSSFHIEQSGFVTSFILYNAMQLGVIDKSELLQDSKHQKQNLLYFTIVV